MYRNDRNPPQHKSQQHAQYQQQQPILENTNQWLTQRAPITSHASSIISSQPQQQQHQQQQRFLTSPHSHQDFNSMIQNHNNNPHPSSTPNIHNLQETVQQYTTSTTTTTTMDVESDAQYIYFGNQIFEFKQESLDSLLQEGISKESYFTPLSVTVHRSVQSDQHVHTSNTPQQNEQVVQKQDRNVAAMITANSNYSVVTEQQPGTQQKSATSRKRRHEEIDSDEAEEYIEEEEEDDEDAEPATPTTKRKQKQKKQKKVTQKKKKKKTSKKSTANESGQKELVFKGALQRRNSKPLPGDKYISTWILK